MDKKKNCDICGDPMPENEQMFKFHGFSGPCPRPPKNKINKNEIKLALVMDDYKVKNREDLWVRALNTQPNIRDNYHFVKEEMIPGVSPKTTTSIRWFEPNESDENKT